MKSKITTLLFLVLTGILFSCDITGSSKSNNNNYPATLVPLSEEAIQAKVQAFHQTNDSNICSSLNPFGLTVGGGCFAPAEQPETPLEEEEAVAIAKQALSLNKAYTNVYNSDALRLADASPMLIQDVPNLGWRVHFQNQVYEDMEVHHTATTVWLTAGGAYRIDGHWYRNFIIPADDKISRAEALEAALGYEFPYSDWTGSQVFTVTNAQLPDSAEVVLGILPYESGERLEMRVVWEFPVGENFPFARLFVDVLEGKVIEHRQLVVF